MLQNCKPIVSVIMGVYNVVQEEQLLKAIQSILNQTLQDFEFIIYDDGSEQETIELLQRMVIKEPRIRLILGEENKGLGYALNECIHMANGDYIARMDADDISLPQRLEKEIEFLEKNTKYQWVGCNTYLMENNKDWGKRSMPEYPDILDFLKYSPYIHPTVVFRKEIFEKGELYSTLKKTVRCEDYELFFRLHLAGYRGYNMQKILFRYREDQESFRKRKFYYRIDETRVRYLYIRKIEISFIRKWIGIIRPILVGIIPNIFVRWYKRKQEKREL